MTPEEFRDLGHRMVDWIASYRANLESRPVMSQVQPGEIARQFPSLPPQHGDYFDGVLDDFERALKVETADRNYAKGVELIYQSLSETLRKMGLEPVQTAGRQFDPNLHQAVERVPTDEAPDQAILGEFQRGYNFKGKHLRPAMVRVAVKP